ncbi:hypothetical protein [Brachyspira intermedia]|uniref:hypothetical protein n=1 Tax=Brachyspira intermedia TaxID=84377 RepID=UPI0030066CED
MKWINKGHEFDEIGNIFKQNKDLLFLGDIEKSKKMKECLSFLDANIIIPNESDINYSEMDINGKTILIFGNHKNIEIFLQSKGLKKNINYFVEYNFYNKYFYERSSDFIIKYLSIFAIYAYDKVYFSSNNIITTTVCNLNCKDCLNFNPYIKNKTHNDIEKLKNDIDIYFNHVDMVGLLHICGGEPTLYPQLSELIYYIYNNYKHKIIDLVLPTNCIKEISDNLAATFKECNIILQIDNYLASVPKYYNIFYENIKKLQSHNVNIDIIEAGINWTWAEGYPPKYDYSKLSDEENIKRFDYCGSVFSEIKDGKISSCCYHSFAETAEIIERDSENAYFDLKGQVNKKELVEFRLKYNNNGYVNFCKKCNGLFPLNIDYVKPAEQSDGILNWDGKFKSYEYITVDNLKIRQDFKLDIKALDLSINLLNDEIVKLYGINSENTKALDLSINLLNDEIVKLYSINSENTKALNLSINLLNDEIIKLYDITRKQEYKLNKIIDTIIKFIPTNRLKNIFRNKINGN